MGKRIVIAVGGNSLVQDKEHQSISDQYNSVVKTVKNIVGFIRDGHEVVVTHGNGPQVGFILLRSELSRLHIHPVPLDSCVADTQGAIGYNFQMAFANEFKKFGIDKSAVTIVTQVVVDRNDPAFKNPSKPIGQFYSEADADIRKKSDGWNMAEDAGRGWRRVVASPEPKEILEIKAIEQLVKNGVIVIAAGGGGIPVVKNDNGDFQGVAAVIDKDYASSLLASNISADVFAVSTAIDKVYLNFGKSDQKAVDKMTVEDAKRYIDEGHFAKGSMLPKIKAIINFLENGGKEAIISDPDHLEAAVAGTAGTRIVC